MKCIGLLNKYKVILVHRVPLKECVINFRRFKKILLKLKCYLKKILFISWIKIEEVSKIVC